MGRRGVPPKPTALKLLHGTEARRINQAEPIARDALPVLPDGVSDEVREVWDYTLAELVAMKCVSAADRDALLCYCEAVVNHRRASRELKKGKILVLGMHGTTMQNPALMVQRNNAELVRRFAQEFGLTPSGRSRVTVSGKKASDGDNPFASAATY